MTLTSVPALIALAIKLLLFLYALKSPIKSANSRLYLALLFCLGLHNLSEVAILTYYPRYGLDATLSGYGYFYFVTFIPFIALVLHLSLRIGFERFATFRAPVLLIYVPAVLLEILLIFSNQLVQGFVPMNQVTIVRDPGPLYFLLETYVVIYLCASLANVALGARGAARPMLARVRARWWLIALAPMASLMVYLIVARHFGLTRISSTIYVPLAQSWFLLISIYATYHYRLFEIDFYIPGSKVRTRKQALYHRIEAVTAEMTALSNVPRAVAALARVLACPVALIGPPKPILALIGAAHLAAVPEEALRNVKRLTVAHEVEHRDPLLYTALRRHGIAAVAPFFPDNPSARAWLLVGENFHEKIYARTDFTEVEKVFERLGALFLDRLVRQRQALSAAYCEIRRLDLIVWDMCSQIDRLNQSLEQERNVLRQSVEISDGIASYLRAAIDAQEWRYKSLDQCLADYEAHVIRLALECCQDNRSEAARLLGVRPNTLHYKLKRQGALRHGEDRVVTLHGVKVNRSGVVVRKSLAQRVQDYEKAIICETLSAAKDSKLMAARMLETPLITLLVKMREHGLLRL